MIRAVRFTGSSEQRRDASAWAPAVAMRGGIVRRGDVFSSLPAARHPLPSLIIGDITGA